MSEPTIEELTAENAALKKQATDLRRDIATTAHSRDVYKDGFETQQANSMAKDKDLKGLLDALVAAGNTAKKVDGVYVVTNLLKSNA